MSLYIDFGTFSPYLFVCLFVFFFSDPNKESPTSPPYTDERAWPAFTIPELQYKELAVNLSQDSALKADKCHFWNEYNPKVRTFAGNVQIFHRFAGKAIDKVRIRVECPFEMGLMGSRVFVVIDRSFLCFCILLF